MGLYNMVFGVNPLSSILLAMLDLQHDKLNPDGTWPVGRFRDIYPNGDGTEIILYTRNGGDNRSHWDFSYEEKRGGDCPCPGCIITYRLPTHPHYIDDDDDDFDNTYAYIRFHVPEEFGDVVKALASGEEPPTVSEKFQRLCEQLNTRAALGEEKQGDGR